MPNRERKEGKCNARVKQIPEDWDVDEAYCNNPQGFRTGHLGEGRCYLHGGSTPKGMINAEKHGLYTKRQNYYKHRSDSERAWIDAVVESLLDDMPGGDDDPSFAKLQMVRNIAIDMHKAQNANDYIDQVGIVERDKTVGYTEDGRPIKEDQENTINIAYDRLTRTLTRQMKELGILDDPESQKAESQQNIADELSKLRAAREAGGES